MFLFLPQFDLFCDKLLNRRAATWNLFLKLRWAWQRWQRSSDYVIILLFKVSYWNIEAISIILTHPLLLLIITSYRSAGEERPIWDITLRKTKVWRFWCRTVTPYSCLEATQQVWRYWITQETSAHNSSISYRACPNYFTMLHVQSSCNQIFGHLRVNCGKLLELRLFQRLILRKTLQNLVKFYEVTGDKETGKWN